MTNSIAVPGACAHAGADHRARAGHGPHAARAAGGDRGARPPARRTSSELIDAGFYRILQPRRFGGYEFDLPTFSRVAIQLARGCPSTGWAFTLTAGHAHLLASYFSEEAQVEIAGADGDIRVPRALPPRHGGGGRRRLPLHRDVRLRLRLRLRRRT